MTTKQKIENGIVRFQTAVDVKSLKKGDTWVGFYKGIECSSKPRPIIQIEPGYDITLPAHTSLMWKLQGIKPFTGVTIVYQGPLYHKHDYEVVLDKPSSWEQGEEPTLRYKVTQHYRYEPARYFGTFTDLNEAIDLMELISCQSEDPYFSYCCVTECDNEHISWNYGCRGYVAFPPAYSGE